MSSDFRPVRIGEVVEQVVEDEVIVYRLETDDVHLLNTTTAAVWRHCNGGSTVAELAALAAADLGQLVDADVVLAALAELDRAGLLVEHVDAPGGFSRRQLMQRLGIAAAAAVALPKVTSIAAPTAAAAASNCSGTGAPCGANLPPCCNQCQEGICS